MFYSSDALEKAPDVPDSAQSGEGQPHGLSIVLKKSAERWLALKQQLNVKSHDRLAQMLLDM